jgi:hypothetical protein
MNYYSFLPLPPNAQSFVNHGRSERKRTTLDSEAWKPSLFFQTYCSRTVLA